MTTDNTTPDAAQAAAEEIDLVYQGWIADDLATAESLRVPACNSVAAIIRRHMTPVRQFEEATPEGIAAMILPLPPPVMSEADEPQAAHDRFWHSPPPVAPESSGFAGHTPGPWCVESDSEEPHIATVARTADNAHDPRPMLWIAQATGGMDESVVWANASLIAAAPTLLAERDALRAELNSFVPPDDRVVELTTLCSVVALERDALREALESQRRSNAGLASEISALRADNARLREALQRVAESNVPPDEIARYLTKYQVATLTRAALADPPA